MLHPDSSPAILEDLRQHRLSTLQHMLAFGLQPLSQSTRLLWSKKNQAAYMRLLFFVSLVPHFGGRLTFGQDEPLDHKSNQRFPPRPSEWAVCPLLSTKLESISVR